jgi:adenylosuccinate synthase
MAERKRLILEGTQGFGLSLLHSDSYPYVTSRDTTAGTFVAEAGLSPMDVDEVVLVIRAHPIRVGGNSGPLPNEIDWPTVTREGGQSMPIIEHTSVTRTVRRVARFDPTVVRDAITVNSPTHIALNHLDYIDAKAGLSGTPTRRVQEFIEAVQFGIGRRIDFIGLGPAVVLPTASPVAIAR